MCKPKAFTHPPFKFFHRLLGGDFPQMYIPALGSTQLRGRQAAVVPSNTTGSRGEFGEQGQLLALETTVRACIVAQKSVLTGNSQPSFHRQRLLCSKSSWAIKPETELLPDSLKFKNLRWGVPPTKDRVGGFREGREFTALNH